MRSPLFALLLVTASLTACHHGAPKAMSQPANADDVRFLEGAWVDQGGVAVSFALINDVPTLTQATDTDGEQFIVAPPRWDRKGAYHFIYTVPSTGYVVDQTVVGYDGESVPVFWDNKHGSGFDMLTRASGRASGMVQHEVLSEPPANAMDARFLVGRWYDGGGSAYDFVMNNDQPMLKRVVDSDGEEFDVQPATWDELGRYIFTYIVPSTEYVVRQTVAGYDGETVSIDWENDNNSGTDVLVREQ